jgi:hypothetical protein
MLSEHVAVACVQVWGKWKLPAAVYLANYAPLVTGAEHPVSLVDPAHVVQFGVEVSSFKASQFGHLQALGIHDAAFPTEALQSEPILAFFRAQASAVTGYAHVLWYEDYAPRLFFGGLGAPYLAPVDAALGAVDFLESRLVMERGAQSWRGLYYKLLNAGLRVAIVGGSDNSCASEEIGDTRTWARIGEEPLTFGRWSAAVAARATSVSDGSTVFLDMHVGGTPIGGELGLAAPAVVDVRAELHVSTGEAASGELRLIRNGVQIASAPYDLPAGGVATLELPVPFGQSAWIAAAADAGAHTGATFVIVADRPIAQAQDAAYWRDYCDAFETQLGAFAVPSVEPAIVARLRAARKVYAALEAVALPAPPGATRYGHSTPACDGPITIGVDSPPSGFFRITCLNAPPSASGLLVLGLAPDPGGTPILGIDLHVGLGSAYVTLPVQSNDGGYAEVPIAFPGPVTFVGQYVWANTAACGNGGPLSASDAIQLQLP